LIFCHPGGMDKILPGDEKATPSGGEPEGQDGAMSDQRQEEAAGELEGPAAIRTS